MSTSQFVNRVLIVAAVVVSIALTWLLRDILISALFAIVIAVGMTIPARLQGVGALLAVFINVALLWLIAIWFAVDPETHIRAGAYLVPRERRLRLLELWRILGETLAIRLRAQSISIAITVTLVYLILGLLLDLPNALIVALFAGIATFIPNIGAFLPLIPIAVFGLASDMPQRLLLWIPVYLVIQLAESNFITPAVVKSELEIPAGAMMVFQLAAALLFGALGLLPAVPLFAVIIVLVREIYSYDALGLRPADAAELPAPAPRPAKQLNSRRRSA